MLADDARANRPLFQITKIDEPDDASMAGTERNSEFSKVLVEGDEHLGVLCGMSEDLVIAGIGAPISHPFHFVPSLLELRLRTGPDAVIQQELQAASSVMMGSTRSWPTTRRA